MQLDSKPRVQGVIFDLDGVIVDTAQYHFEAWKTVASEWKYNLTAEDNEQLKGVSRKDSIAKIASWAGIIVSAAELNEIAAQKNKKYLALCNALSPKHILPGIVDLIHELKANAIQIALGSASKNARFVIEKLGLSKLFDVIIDGNDVNNSKPNPEVFLKAAQQMKLSPQACVVIEDAPAGIQAALAAGMGVVGLGNISDLKQANLVLQDTKKLTLEQLNQVSKKIVP